MYLYLHLHFISSPPCCHGWVLVGPNPYLSGSESMLGVQSCSTTCCCCCCCRYFRCFRWPTCPGFQLFSYCPASSLFPRQPEKKFLHILTNFFFKITLGARWFSSIWVSRMKGDDEREERCKLDWKYARSKTSICTEILSNISYHIPLTFSLNLGNSLLKTPLVHVTMPIYICSRICIRIVVYLCTCVLVYLYIKLGILTASHFFSIPVNGAHLQIFR